MKRIIQILLIVNCSLLTLPREIKYKLCIFLFFILFYLTGSNCYSQWVQQTIPVSKPITGIKFIDSLRGWACTSIGTGGFNECYILHTTNGGTNWFVQYTAPNATFNAICVIDSNYIYAGGDSAATAKFSKTTNGGLNWIDVPTPVNMSIDDMVFLNKDSGWTTAGNVGADVRTTTNGGLNWIVRTSGIAQQTQRIFFLNYNTGYCGANTFLYMTTNSGLNWNLAFVFSDMVESLFFLNNNTGWAGLSPGGSARVGYTTNGGANWTIQFLQPYNVNITDIFTTNNQIVYACAPVGLGKIYKTTNTGATWGYQNVPTGSNKMSFIDTSIGWTGNNGISKTTNGGGVILGIRNISNTIPDNYFLFQNYPNPFNSSSKIKFNISKSTFVSLKIFDELGREIITLVHGKLNAGIYETDFEANDLPSGLYFYNLQTEGFSVTKKMILVK